MEQSFVPRDFPDPPAPQCRNAPINPRGCKECTGVHMDFLAKTWEDPAVAHERMRLQANERVRRAFSRAKGPK